MSRAGVLHQVRSNISILRELPLFRDLEERDLVRICGTAARRTVAAGEVVMEEGAPGDGLYVIVDGELEVSKNEGEDGAVILARRGPGEFIGELSLLAQEPRSASVRAVAETELLMVTPEDFQELLEAHPATARSLLATVASRLRSTEASLMQRERLASLGTLAAGLAHELNNPAAAILRASAHLGAALDTLNEVTEGFSERPLSPGGRAAVEALRENLRASDARGGAASPAAGHGPAELEEDRIREWLEERGVGEAWNLAPALAGAGLTATDLRDFAGALSPAEVGRVVRWAAAVADARALLSEIEQSARTMSEIVGAVRRYSYLDQAPIQPVDLRESLESTLVMLRHRLKRGVRVVRRYDPEIPAVEAYGSELGQVWTNLVTNALDAMEEEGVLELAVRQEGGEAVVEVTDDGSGIPEEIRDRIFDPFFTTKPPGAGSGLGLHIAYNIVVNRHRGRIEVESEPGRTCFRIRLPLRLARSS